MATMNLTAKFVDSVTPTGRRADYWDTLVPGLVLRVSEQGAKSWSVLYRHRGRRRRLTLGGLDALTLAQARERARKELNAVSDGKDPAQVKQDGRKAETIADLADLYIAKWAKPRKRSWKQDRHLLDKHVLPQWRYRAIVDITRQDVRQLIERVAESGAPVQANRVTSLLSKLFAFALDRDLVPFSPAARMKKPTREHARDRVLTDDEIRALWTAWEALPLPLAAFFQLRFLTAQRGGEVTNMRWQDIDLKSCWWTIPATSSKNRLSHRVPLNPSAAAILASLLATADKDAIYALGAYQRVEGAGARGKRQQSEAIATFPVYDFKPHDLRRTAASLMASGGIPRLTISKILNHVERSVTAVYDRHSYDAEKQSALTWWDRRLASILQNNTAAVLPFIRVG